MVNLGYEKNVVEGKHHSGILVPKDVILGELNQGQSGFEDRHWHSHQ